MKIYGIRSFTDVLKGHIRHIRPTWLLEELEIPYEMEMLEPDEKSFASPEFLAKNPFGRAPVLEDGDFVLYESGAICAYLAQKAGRMIPKAGTKEYAIHDQWMNIATTTMEPNTMRIFACDFFYEKDETTGKIRELAEKMLVSPLHALEKTLQEQPYLMGRDFQVADLFLTSVSRPILGDAILKPFPKFKAYLEKNFARPAFGRAMKHQL